MPAMRMWVVFPFSPASFWFIFIGLESHLRVLVSKVVAHLA